MLCFSQCLQSCIAVIEMCVLLHSAGKWTFSGCERSGGRSRSAVASNKHLCEAGECEQTLRMKSKTKNLRYHWEHLPRLERNTTEAVKSVGTFIIIRFDAPVSHSIFLFSLLLLARCHIAHKLALDDHFTENNQPITHSNLYRCWDSFFFAKWNVILLYLCLRACSFDPLCRVRNLIYCARPANTRDKFNLINFLS